MGRVVVVGMLLSAAVKCGQESGREDTRLPTYTRRYYQALTCLTFLPSTTSTLIHHSQLFSYTRSTQLLMTRKTRRKNKPQRGDLEAQAEDEGMYALQLVSYTPFTILHKGVGQSTAREMSTLTSGREGESSEVTGSNVLVGEADRKAQAGSSTQSQAQPPKDGPSNSGEHITISYYHSDFGT
jgi:hypothetical protein